MKNKFALVSLLILVGSLAFIMFSSSTADIYSEITSVNSNEEIITMERMNVTDLDFSLDPSAVRIRTTQDKIYAMEQFIAGKGTLVMFHYASCCKSTLSEWFDRIRRKLQRLHHNWNSTIQHMEVTHGFHEQFGQSIEAFVRSHPHTIFVICFGEPLKRILAQYDKEWRWGCKRSEGCGAQTYMAQYNKSLLSKDNYVSIVQHDGMSQQEMDQRFGAIDFNDFLIRIIRFEMEQKSENDKQYQMFLNDYYLWSLCCDKEECNMARDVERKIQECVTKALNLIHGFDLVFISDWIRDLRVQHFVNELFFTDNNVDKQRNDEGFVAVAKKSYRVSSIGTNYMYDPDNEPLLRHLNQYDLKLFEWVQDLVFNRTHVVWERAKYNKNNRNELIYGLGYKNIISTSHQ
eukprot:197636_1